MDLGWCSQLWIVFIVIDFKLFSSTMFIFTHVIFVIFSDWLFEKDSWNRKPFKHLAGAVVVNIIPCLSYSPILIGWITITQKSMYIVNIFLCLHWNHCIHTINPMTSKLMYHHTSNYIKLEINIYTEINATNARNQIIIENNICN